jgi:hypothetical protein
MAQRCVFKQTKLGISKKFEDKTFEKTIVLANLRLQFSILIFLDSIFAYRLPLNARQQTQNPPRIIYIEKNAQRRVMNVYS